MSGRQNTLASTMKLMQICKYLTQLFISGKNKKKKMEVKLLSN